MAPLRRSTFSHMFTGCLLTTAIIAEFLLAVPVSQPSREHDVEKINAELSSKRLIRNRRNISWYKQNSDFWNWYKFFTDNGNQQGVADLDRVYLEYLQNKNRAESQRSYKLYLQHMGEIYKSCAESEDPNCVNSYMSRPKPKPEPQRQAQIKPCDPYRDPQCLYALGYSAYPYVASVKSPAPASAPAPAPAPAPVKTPAYIRTPVVKNPSSGQYYYAPTAQSFLSAEQKAELLRICGAEDVECLQYHFRGAYGYKPAGVPAPSYAHLGSSSQKVQKAPASLYLQYPNCDSRVNPYCAYGAVAASQKSDAPSSPASLERFCNPLYEDNCNPLTSTRYGVVAHHSEDPKDDPASVAGPIQDLQNSPFDPYAMFQDAAAAASSAMRRLPPGSHQIPQHPQPPTMEENSQSFGPPGKTKEGYDCFIGYDEECYPIRTQNVPRTFPQRQLPHSMANYEPHLNADGTRKGVIEPDPHCDPEYDRNCRLQRYVPEAEEPEMYSPKEERDHQEHREEPVHHKEQREDVYPDQQPDNQGYEQQQQYDRYMSGQEDSYASYDQPNQGSINFQDILKAYASRFPNQEHQHPYTGDYKKK
ncbi:actinodin1 [Tachysurus ichikawai]